jgi:DNA-directed RNA polymerase beta' subunit
MLYNTLLCRILDIFCGKLSHNKFISDKIIFSNKECLKGFLDAYIGGDGCINPRSKNITIGSTSKNMLIDVQQILNIFDIYTRLYKPPKQQSNNRGSKDIKQMYHLCVDGKQAFKLAEFLDMKIQYKKDAVTEILNHKHHFEYAKKYEKVPNEIDGEIVFEERNCRFTDVLFDKIKSIEEVQNTTNYAYDLTVEKTRNFNINNSLCMVDTFHKAGVGSGSLVITEGIPRLREIINISKNPKSKNMVIYLSKEFSDNKDNAKKIQSKFGYTQLKDILAKTEILYDNKYGIVILYFSGKVI